MCRTRALRELLRIRTAAAGAKRQTRFRNERNLLHRGPRSDAPCIAQIQQKIQQKPVTADLDGCVQIGTVDWRSIQAARAATAS